MTSNGSSRLKSATDELVRTASDRAIGAVSQRVSGATDRLEGLASGTPAKATVGALKSKAEGGSSTTGALKGTLSSVKDKVKDKLPGGSSKSDNGGKATDSTNIIEQIDVGVPLRVAYNQWTEFGGFPSFMKKVENVETEEDNKLEFKAQIFWSHRSWEATILEQVPDERIVWRSKGEKGHVDGAVTFHELGPNLTRILVVLEYYPQGFMEKTGNIWRAQGRRARAELKHFRRHVMTRTILDPEEVEGWRGTIHDGEVVESHEDAMEREAQESGPDQEQSGQDQDQSAESDQDAGDDTQDQADSDQADADEGDETQDTDEEYSEEEPADEADDYAEESEGDEPTDESDGEESDDEESDDEESEDYADEYEEPEADTDEADTDEESEDSEYEEPEADTDEADTDEADTDEESEDSDDSDEESDAEQDLAPDEELGDEDEQSSQSRSRRRAS